MSVALQQNRSRPPSRIPADPPPAMRTGRSALIMRRGVGWLVILDPSWIADVSMLQDVRKIRVQVDTDGDASSDYEAAVALQTLDLNENDVLDYGDGLLVTADDVKRLDLGDRFEFGEAETEKVAERVMEMLSAPGARQRVCAKA